jgi:hypothetical protein
MSFVYSRNHNTISEYYLKKNSLYITVGMDNLCILTVCWVVDNFSEKGMRGWGASEWIEDTNGKSTCFLVFMPPVRLFKRMCSCLIRKASDEYYTVRYSHVTFPLAEQNANGNYKCLSYLYVISA